MNYYHNEDYAWIDYKKRARDKYKKYLSSPEWAAKREKKLEQVGHKCELCGVGSDTHQLFIHHKNYYSVYHERMSDLEVLCEDGHDYRHSRRREPCSNFKPVTILRKRNDAGQMDFEE